MKIETRFSIGDRVHTVSNGRVFRVDHDACPVCSATETPGQVTISGEAFTCPKCGGKKEVRVERYGWWVSECSEVGQISLVVRDANDAELPEDEKEVRYMLHATGVGSGTCWSSEHCFATRAEAQAWCDARNT